MPTRIFKHKRGYKRKPFSEEWKRKIGKARKGKKHSDETKQKISETRLKRKEKLGYLNSFKTREKIRKAMLGKRNSPKTEFKRGCKSIKFWLGKKRPEMKTGGRLREKIIKTLPRGENHPHWQGGKSFEPYTTDWTKTLKRSIRERDKYTCQICMKEPATYCHHIDYNKKNCNPDNLITLCNSCHSKTNHNRNYWINYFFYRRRIIIKSYPQAGLTSKYKGIG